MTHQYHPHTVNIIMPEKDIVAVEKLTDNTADWAVLLWLNKDDQPVFMQDNFYVIISCSA